MERSLARDLWSGSLEANLGKCDRSSRAGQCNLLVPLRGLEKSCSDGVTAQSSRRLVRVAPVGIHGI